MPFTISHAAAALPLRRLGGGRLPLAAMMVGAMSPDFAYFASFGPERVATHDIAGVFWFCLPVGLALWLLFDRFFERPTVALLPQPWRAHFMRPREALSLRLLIMASVGIVIGALTHLAWDAFTHGDTVVSRNFSVMQAEMFRIAGHRVPLYWLLQLLSSLFGAVVLAIWFIRAPWAEGERASIPDRSPIPDFARAAALLALITVSCCVGLASYFDHSGWSLENRMFFLAMAGMKGFAITWAAIVFFVDRFLHTVRRSSGRPGVPASPAY